jgi:hypothetical protein
MIRRLLWPISIAVFGIGIVVTSFFGTMFLLDRMPGAAGAGTTSYSPLITACTASGGSAPATRGNYYQSGKLTCVDISVVFPANFGTATGFYVSLPNANAFYTNFNAADATASVAFFGHTVSPGAVFAYTAAGGAVTPIAGHTYSINGCYQNS